MKKYFFGIFFIFFVISICICNKDNKKEGRHKEGCILGMRVEKSEECLEKSHKDTNCCALKSDFPKGKFCFPMKDYLYNGNDQITFGDKTYKIKCQRGKKEDEKKRKKPKFGDLCGKNPAKSKSDCLIGSTEDSTCCYYNMFGMTGCIHLGSIYEGKTNVGRFEVECGNISDN